MTKGTTSSAGGSNRALSSRVEVVFAVMTEGTGNWSRTLLCAREKEKFTVMGEKTGKSGGRENGGIIGADNNLHAANE